MLGLFTVAANAQTPASADKNVTAKATTKPMHKTAVSSSTVASTTAASPKKATASMRRKKHARKHKKAHTPKSATPATK